MSEEKCNNYCELMYCDENKFGVFCKKNKLKCSYILEQQLQTAKEENEKLKLVRENLVNQLNIDNQALAFECQQNKQMREALEKIVKTTPIACNEWFYSCDNRKLKCKYAQHCEAVCIAKKMLQALKGVE